MKNNVILGRKEKQNSGCFLGADIDWDRGLKELSGVMELFYILTGMLVTQIYIRQSD